MTVRPKRLAILNSPATPRGVRQHMVAFIEDFLRESGVEVIHLYGTDRFVPADALFVHVDLSVVPDSVGQFASRYPIAINAHATDIRKHRFVDGLLEAGADYPLPVIVKSDLNYGGTPEFHALNLFQRATRKAGRILMGTPAAPILEKSSYKVFPSLSDVPPRFFSPHTVVQKMLPEKDGDMYVLREYMFLGDLHYESIERSEKPVFTEDYHVSCLPVTPHPRLLAMRRQLRLDYGKIDYVMHDGVPFIFDANKTMGLGAYGNTSDFAQDIIDMLRAFAESVHHALIAGRFEASGPALKEVLPNHGHDHPLDTVAAPAGVPEQHMAHAIDDSTEHGENGSIDDMTGYPERRIT